MQATRYGVRANRIKLPASNMRVRPRKDVTEVLSPNGWRDSFEED